MDAALLLARLLLGAVFLVAALTKLADQAGSRQSMAGFGIPRPLVTPFAVLLPLIELAIAAALVPARSAWWAALGALALLLLFMVGIGINLVRGRRPDCHCFGQLHSEPVGPVTLGRNGVLAAVAGLIISQGPRHPGIGAIDWLVRAGPGEEIAVLGALLAVVVLVAQWWFLMNLLRQNGRLLARLETVEAALASRGVLPARVEPATRGLPIGSPAPMFALSNLDGQAITLDSLRLPGKPVMLIFSDPDCGPCSALLPTIGRWQRDATEQVTVAVITGGASDASRPGAVEHGLTRVLAQHDREVSQAYGVRGTPSAVVVDPQGRIASGIAAGPDAIRSLMAHTVGPRASGSVPFLAEVPAARDAPAAAARAPRLGQPAPPITLPGLDGATVALDHFHGDWVLVLFWNPGCGFCRRMLPDLKAWESQPPEGAPKLLIVSAGGPDANRAQGIVSPVVLDEGFSTGRAYGATGTPTGVLVGPDGAIASRPAAGAPAVLALMGKRDHPVKTVTA